MIEPESNVLPEHAGTAQYCTFKSGSAGLLVRFVTPSVGQREAPILQTEVKTRIDAMAKGAKYLVLDFSSVSVLSSMGLGMCVDFYKQAKARKVKTVLFGLNEHLRQLFRMVKVDKLFTIVDSKDQLKKLLDG